MGRRHLSRLSRYTVALTLLATLGLLIGPASATAATKGHAAQTTLRKGELPPQNPPSKPQQPPPKTMPSVGRASVVKAAAITGPIDAKVLVIAADGNEADLPAIKQTLDFLGEPYTVYIASQTPGGLTPSKLTDPANSAHALYQGVILTTGSLGYTSNGAWIPSALTQAEWTALANFEVAFGIRQVTWYTYPTADYGFAAPANPNGMDTSTTPLSVPFTTDGKTLFGTYANTATPLKIQYAWTYQAKPLTDGNTQALLTDAAGNALVAIRSYKDGAGTVLRQNLALTFDSNANLTHNLVLAYGLVNWVTKGVFLGDRHTYLLAQPDDVFNDDDIWYVGRACGSTTDNTGVTYRISDKDLKAVVAWQQAKQGQPTTGALTIEMPFNGVGTTAAWIASEGHPAGQFSPDTLTPYVTTNQGQFNWISHTWDHENLDAITYDAATAELTQNDTLADQLALNYTDRALVTPDVSGLTNINFLNAAYDNGARYLVSDTSRAGYNNPSPNAGITNPLKPQILMIPRHPTNLYFNVSTPQEWLAEDNCLYPTGAYGHVGTYQQLVDRESTVLLNYLIRGDIDPLMFHQPNLRAYDGTHTLLSDLLDATFTKYNALFKLPIKSLTEEEIGVQMANRMGYNAGGVTAQIVTGRSITIKATKAATVPVTGVKGTCATCTTETYGGQTITKVKLAAGQSITLALT